MTWRIGQHANRSEKVQCSEDPKMTARIVLHGKQAQNEDLREAVKAVRDDDLEVEVRVTWEAGDAFRLAREAARLGCKRVIAGGGDGTVNEVLTGLMSEGFEGTLGLLPLGTANDFARSAGVPLELEPALRLALTSEGHAVDVGKVGARYFLNVATGGFGVDITTQTDPRLKQALGGAAYFLTGVAKFGSVEPSWAKVTVPGDSWEGELLVLGIGNGRQAGGGHELCPEAVLDDGLFDVVVLPNLGMPVHEALGQLMRRGPDALEDATYRWRVPWVEVASTDALTVNLDGEPEAASTHRFELLPGALSLALPEDSPLLGRATRSSQTPT